MIFQLLGIEDEDRRSFGWSAGWFATVLGAYYIVRPVREALGSVEGSKNLPWLFTAVFLTMLVAVPLYSHLVARYSRRQLVPIIYRFLMLNLIVFSLAMRLFDEQTLKYVARVFFVWVSVYVLFSTSLFWSVQADVFSRERGKRLFGGIAGFGTLGAILASLFVGSTAETFGPANLLLVSAALMETGLWCFRRLDASGIDVPSPTDGRGQRSANPFDGFIQVVCSPYLRSIMLFVFSTTICGTYLYLTQADMLNAAYPDNAARTAVFAKLDFATQTVTVICQLLVASRLMKFSLPLTLCILPGIYALAFSGLTVSPVLAILMTAMVLSRATTYGLAVPALGVLYTGVSRDDKYKAKSVIDTIVIRGGDAGTNWAVTGVRHLGLVGGMLHAAMVPFALFGIGLVTLLARRRPREQAANVEPGEPTAATGDPNQSSVT